MVGVVSETMVVVAEVVDVLEDDVVEVEVELDVDVVVEEVVETMPEVMLYRCTPYPAKASWKLPPDIAI